VEPTKLKDERIVLRINRTMAKTITIRDDLYERLRALKGDASLDDFIEQLLGGGKGTDVLRRMRKTLELSSEEKERILREIYMKREEKRAFDDRAGLP